MLGNPKKPVTILIDPQEVVTLANRYSTTQSMDTAADVWRAFFRSRPKSDPNEWDLLAAIAAIYDAGRVQGIREERRRRSQSNS